MQNGSGTCAILRVDSIKYDNPALNKGIESLVDLFKTNGINAVNSYLDQSNLVLQGDSINVINSE